MNNFTICVSQACYISHLRPDFLDEGFVADLGTVFEMDFSVLSTDLVVLCLAPTLATGLTGLKLCLLSIDLGSTILSSTLDNSFLTGLATGLEGALITLLTGLSAFLAR